MSSGVQLICVEVGGSGIETVVFHADGSVERRDDVFRPVGTRLAIATPGLIANGRVIAASNLDWWDVDPAEQLGLGAPAEIVLNDAEAAALGEVALRDAATADAVFLCLGTGVGGAVVIDSGVGANLELGHLDGFSDRPCPCGKIGCLETVAGGWALPAVLSDTDIDTIAASLAAALDREPLASPRLVVLGGGIAAKYPSLRDRLAVCVPDRVVERSAAPTGFKSASAWGLRHALERAAMNA